MSTNFYKNQSFKKREHGFRRQGGRYKDPVRSIASFSLKDGTDGDFEICVAVKKKKKMSPGNHEMLMIITTVIKEHV